MGDPMCKAIIYKASPSPWVPGIIMSRYCTGGGRSIPKKADKSGNGRLNLLEFQIFLRGTWLYFSGLDEDQISLISAHCWDTQEVHYDIVHPSDIPNPLKSGKSVPAAAIPRIPMGSRIQLLRSTPQGQFLKGTTWIQIRDQVDVVLDDGRFVVLRTAEFKIITNEQPPAAPIPQQVIEETPAIATTTAPAQTVAEPQPASS